MGHHESSPSHSNIKSLITDHCNKHNTNEKNELLKCDTETQREQNAVRKMVPKDTPSRAASNLKLFLKGSICEAAKQSQSTIK